MSSLYQRCATEIDRIGLTDHQKKRVLDILSEYDRLLEAQQSLEKEEIQLALLKRKSKLEREKSILHLYSSFNKQRERFAKTFGE